MCGVILRNSRIQWNTMLAFFCKTQIYAKTVYMTKDSFNIEKYKINEENWILNLCEGIILKAWLKGNQIA